MAAEEPWKHGGLVRGVGIPAPSGRYAVGCVDLMHQLDGDEQGGLLVRLFYPTACPSPSSMPSRYPYAKWIPHPSYVRGYAIVESSIQQRMVGSIAVDGGDKVRRSRGLMKKMDPKIPAHEGAPLIAEYSRLLEPASPTDARPSAAGEEVSGPFPVVVFSHGLGGMRTCNSCVVCDLASQGYVVAAVEHRDGSACTSNRRVRDGKSGRSYRDEWLPFRIVNENEKEFPLRYKQVRQRADEVKRSLDLLCLLNNGERVENMMDVEFDFTQFKGRIDVGRAAVVGHSFGGATTVQTLSEDPRFMCGIALDSWMVPIHRDLYETGLQSPLLFINCSDDFQWVENVQRMMKLSQPPDENGMTPRRVITIRGTNHMSQSDMPFVMPSFKLLEPFKPPRDPTEAFSLTMDVCHAFLWRHQLQDPRFLRPVPNLDGLKGHSEYLIFGTNLDLGTSDDKETWHKMMTSDNRKSKL